MCTYSQLKKKKLCTTPQGVKGSLNVPKLYTSCGIDISQCTQGGSMILVTQVDYIL